MIQFLAESAFIAIAWKKYSTTIISTVVVLVYFFVVSKLHEDFVNYSSLVLDKQYLGISFVVKWIAWLFGAILYLFIGFRYSNKVHIKKVFNNTSIHSSTKDKKDSQKYKSNPFENISKRGRLRSKSDFILEKRK